MDVCSHLLKKPYCLAHYFDINTLLLSWLVSKFWLEWIQRSKKELSPNIRFLLKMAKDFIHRTKFGKTQSYSWDSMFRKFGVIKVPLIRRMLTLDFDVRLTRCELGSIVRIRIRWVGGKRDKTPLSYIIRKRKQVQTHTASVSRLELDSITEFWIEEHWTKSSVPMLNPTKFYENGRWITKSCLSPWKFIPCSYKKVEKFMHSLHCTRSMMMKRIEQNDGRWKNILIYIYWVMMQSSLPFDVWCVVRSFLMIEGHSKFIHFSDKVKNEIPKDVTLIEK
jgi:hypothetical protein